MKHEINEKLFILTCKKSVTMNVARKKLNLPFTTFKRYATKFKCYKPNRGAKGTSKILKKLDDVLKNTVSIRNHNLKHKLFKTGLKKYECEKCHTKKWQGKKITLELHHKDGNRKNNILKNLQILCPNCHSQTKNYRRWKRNGMKEKKERK